MNTRVIILQHPDEVKRPLGTAVIAQRCLESCEIRVGEDFSQDDTLNTLLLEHQGQVAVLFPGESAIAAVDWHKQQASQNDQQRKQLIVVLDGTWRKAYKMWQLSTNLHALPQIKLPEDLQGNYRIRKAPSDNALSTVESIAELLRITEPNAAATDTLLAVFNGLIEAQWARIPDEVKAKNYR